MGSNTYENWVDRVIHSHKQILENIKNGRSQEEMKTKEKILYTEPNQQDYSNLKYQDNIILSTPNKAYKDNQEEIERCRKKSQMSEIPQMTNKFQKPENNKYCVYCENCENSPKSYLNSPSPRQSYFYENSCLSDSKKKLHQLNYQTAKSERRNSQVTNKDYNLNHDLEIFKNSKFQKLVDSLIQENAELKIRLQDSDRQLALSKSNLSSREQENYSNSQIFIERERDLIETVNLFDIENKKMNERLSEMKIVLMKKSKDLEMALSVNESVRNNRNNLNSSNLKGMVDEEYLFKCLKLEKVIEVMNNFFKKFEVSKDLTSNIKNFDYEGIRIKLDELEQKFQNFLKSSFENKENFNLNLNLTTDDSHKKPDIHLEPDFLSKLDSRLKEVESNLNNVFKNKNDKLVNVSQMNLTQSSNTSSCQLNCSNTKKRSSSNLKFTNVKTEKNIKRSLKDKICESPKKFCGCKAHEKLRKNQN